MSLQSKGLSGGSSTTVQKPDQMVVLFFNILKNLHCFPQRLHQFIFPPSVKKGFLSSTPLPAFIFCLFDDSHPNRCEGIAHCRFDFQQTLLRAISVLRLPRRHCGSSHRGKAYLGETQETAACIHRSLGTDFFNSKVYKTFSYINSPDPPSNPGKHLCVTLSAGVDLEAPRS